MSFSSPIVPAMHMSRFSNKTVLFSRAEIPVLD